MHKLLEGRLGLYITGIVLHMSFLFSPFIYIFKSFTHISLDLNVLHAAIMQFILFYFTLKMLGILSSCTSYGSSPYFYKCVCGSWVIVFVTLFHSHLLYFAYYGNQY